MCCCSSSSWKARVWLKLARSAAGVASGVLWNAGNVGSILAVLPPLGLTAGYPITQSCLLVSGLWGICAFGELRGARAIGGFFAAALVVLSGAALLGVYGAA